MVQYKKQRASFKAHEVQSWMFAQNYLNPCVILRKSFLSSLDLFSNLLLR